MSTQLGEMLRLIRIKTGDSMRQMAEKLGLSSSYLSAIENGKRNVPKDFDSVVEAHYELTSQQVKDLKEAIALTSESVKVDLTDLSEKHKKLIYALANESLEESTLNQLCEIIEKKK